MRNHAMTMREQAQSVPGRSQLQSFTNGGRRGPVRTESVPQVSSYCNSHPLTAAAVPSPHQLATESHTIDDTSVDARDSLESIIDDPFLIRYTIAASPETEQPPPSTSLTTSPRTRHIRDATPSTWPASRKESLTNQSQNQWASFSDDETMESFNIAVIGALGVGKSSFIQRALRLSRPPSSSVATARAEVEGAPYAVTLIEIDLEYFDVEDFTVPGRHFQWPRQVDGHALSDIDGALVLYDVTNEQSIAGVTLALTTLSANGHPFVLAATKCDVPETQRKVDTVKMAAISTPYSNCVCNFKTSFNVPESQRDCLQTVLKASVANRGDRSDATAMSRRRAASVANLDAPLDSLSGRPISQHSKHSRASSDLSLVRAVQAAGTDAYSRGPASRSSRLGSQTQQGDGVMQTVASLHRTPGIRLDHGGDAFLDIDESGGDLHRFSDEIPILQRSDEHFLLDRPARLAGVSFFELVDRLLAPRMSRADNNFADIFLCLYRKFAAPGELLTAICTRLDRVKEDKGTHYLLRAETQLRIVEVVAKWLSLYPGDFARPTTRHNLELFIQELATEPMLLAAAQQMWAHLDSKVVEDDDTGWEQSDSILPAAETDLGKEVGYGASELSGSIRSIHLDDASSTTQGRQSQSSELSGLAPPPDRKAPVRFQFHSVEDYEREAATMVPTAVLPLTKIRYRVFMDYNPDDIADEITRIDWVMFSSIRIRDLVRHVSLPADQKERCKSLKNVNRMISHFNHVARWVASMILIRDKAKHRAPSLEKFMVIAQRLRQLNNYNGLAAVLAGINGTSIHRLAQTRALVDEEVQKRFARLVLLMGTQKSHFAYRLAWENSPMPRIPFMPLHRRDLVSAEEGSRTFVGPQGDRINWKKFEVLGEVILPIMKSQGTPYQNLNKHEPSRELILDCRILTDEEDLYQRSVQVESNASGVLETGKKRFPWLPK